MPLLTSPIDGSPMRQINRYGIEIDVCPTSGGIWLDKGELEKLMVMLREESTNDHHAPYRDHHNSSGPKGRYRDDDDDDDDDYHHKHKGGSYGHSHGKKSKISRMMDIFDF